MVNYPAGFAKFITNFWMKTRDEKRLVYVLLGPLDVMTQMNGSLTQIITDSNYPFDEKLIYTIDLVELFELALRIPAWASGATHSVNNGTIKAASPNSASQQLIAIGATEYP